MMKIKLLVLTLLLSSCGGEIRYSRYTHELNPLFTLNKKDTVYLKYAEENTYGIIVNNDTINEIMFLKRANIYDTELLEKEIWTYNEIEKGK